MQDQEYEQQRSGKDRRTPVQLPIDGKLTAKVAGLAVALYFFGSQIVEIRTDQKSIQTIIQQILIKQTEQAKDIEYIKEEQRQQKKDRLEQRGKDDE